MWLSTFLALIIVSYPAGASTPTDCDEIENRKITLSVHASNLANTFTTRTPDGEPYKPKSIQRCANGKCEIAENTAFKLGYQPGHPDGDSDGYVKYPNVDSKAELICFEATFAELVALAGKKSCGLELVPVDGAFLVKYPQAKSEATFLFIA